MFTVSRLHCRWFTRKKEENDNVKMTIHRSGIITLETIRDVAGFLPPYHEANHAMLVPINSHAAWSNFAKFMLAKIHDVSARLFRVVHDTIGLFDRDIYHPNLISGLAYKSRVRIWPWGLFKFGLEK